MNYNNLNFNAAHKSASLILKTFFNPKMALISVPVFRATQGSVPVVTVQLYYFLGPSVLSYNGNTTSSVDINTLETLNKALTTMYESVMGQTINVKLELVQHYHPYLDATILAQYLALNASKYGFTRMMNYLLSVVPYISPASPSGTNMSYTTGVKVQLSGLLTSQRNSARKSVYTASAGTFHTSDMGKIQGLYTVIHHGSHTTKSRLGSFCVNV